MSVQRVPSAGTAELALRLNALRGTAVYGAYLADADGLGTVLVDLDEELRAIDPDLETEQMSPSDGEQLIAGLAAIGGEAVLVDASRFRAEDWALIDRRRSSLARSGLLVFVTTPSSFEALMRSAPNLASWLGAQVFAHEPEGAEIAAVRDRRLAALRTWASRSDADVIESARSGTLPPDPEYAEWLVLLGHGELLTPRGA